VRNERGHDLIRVHGARENSLSDVSVEIPKRRLTVVSGVSGCGMSSLLHGSILASAGVVAVDHAPTRGACHSNPEMYTGVLEPIRKAFAKANSVKPALFGASPGDACPVCKGAGVIYADLAMLVGVATVCEACDGKRFSPRC